MNVIRPSLGVKSTVVKSSATVVKSTLGARVYQPVLYLLRTKNTCVGTVQYCTGSTTVQYCS